MTRRTRFAYAAVCSLATAAGCLGGAGVKTALARTDGLSAPYERRIEYIEAWGRRFPGAPDPSTTDLGVVTGILLHTIWQKDSGRDVLPIWSRLNAGVSIQPYRLALEYVRDGLDCVHGAFVTANRTRDAADAPLTREDVCRAWRTYFVTSDALRARGLTADPVTPSGAQRCLWAAHTKSIVHELWQHRDDLLAAAVPEAERRFWENSIALVFALADIDYPTNVPDDPAFSARLLPACSPLGEPGCQLDRFSGVQHEFLVLLTATERNIQSLIDAYLAGQARRGPPCTAASGPP